VNGWDQRSLQFRNVLQTAIVVAVVLVFAYFADGDRDTAGWLFVVGFAVVGLVAAFLIARRVR
jgi:RsiW-degrading membrane proteinase PrsW (M82 family)